MQSFRNSKWNGARQHVRAAGRWPLLERVQKEARQSQAGSMPRSELRGGFGLGETFPQQGGDFHFEGLTSARGESGESEWLKVSDAAAHGEQHLGFRLQESIAHFERQRDLAAFVDVDREFQQAASDRELLHPGRELAAVFKLQDRRNAPAQGDARGALGRAAWAEV